jgi:predicted ribosome quality control (RQC) complex YloA/Tae2 family protein
MEGLFINKMLQQLGALLPARVGAWVFPSETTASVLLEGHGNLVFNYQPPAPALYLEPERMAGSPNNAFQRQLASKVRGRLTRVVQFKLDRVALLEFSGESGFVDVPPVWLLFELTGRNANVLLLEPNADFPSSTGEDWEGRILSTAREIASSRNRFRTIRSGGRYTLPPPYQKLDPRDFSSLELAGLEQLPLGKWHTGVDGLGPTLSLELATRAGQGLRDVPVDLERAEVALRSLVERPSLSTETLSEQAIEVRQQDKEAALRKSLREPLERRQNLLGKQIGDLEKAKESEIQAQIQRQHADLLLAYQYTFPKNKASGKVNEGIGLETVELPDFYSGEAVTIALEPSLSLINNAEKMYAKARRREEVRAALEQRVPKLRAELQQVKQLLNELESASLKHLEAMIHNAPNEQGNEQGNKAATFGHRFRLSSGLELWVGRNTKENEYLTHRLGRSLDFWFHAQGYPGSHVLVRSGGRDLSLEEILEAARIAAHFSKARGDLNVPVDYTRVKHVWKRKGAGAGQVHYTHQKTVFVDPKLPPSSDLYTL